MSGDYIKAEGKAGRMGARLMAIVAEGERGRIYLPPTAGDGSDRAPGEADSGSRMLSYLQKHSVSRVVTLRHESVGGALHRLANSWR